MGARRASVTGGPEIPPCALLLDLLPIEARRLGVNAESVAMSEAFERYLFHWAPVETFAKPSVANGAVATHVGSIMDVDTSRTEQLGGQCWVLAERERPLGGVWWTGMLHPPIHGAYRTGPFARSRDGSVAFG